MFPKPRRGSAAAARRARRQRLKKHRDRVKLEVLERDGYTCQHEGCEAPSGPPHHIYGRGNSPDHPYEQADAILSLCPDCHHDVTHIGNITRDDIIKDLERVLSG